MSSPPSHHQSLPVMSSGRDSPREQYVQMPFSEYKRVQQQLLLTGAVKSIPSIIAELQVDLEHYKAKSETFRKAYLESEDKCGKLTRKLLTQRTPEGVVPSFDSGKGSTSLRSKDFGVPESMCMDSLNPEDLEMLQSIQAECVSLHSSKQFKDLVTENVKLRKQCTELGRKHGVDVSNLMTCEKYEEVIKELRQELLAEKEKHKKLLQLMETKSGDTVEELRTKCCELQEKVWHYEKTFTAKEMLIKSYQQEYNRANSELASLSQELGKLRIEANNRRSKEKDLEEQIEELKQQLQKSQEEERKLEDLQEQIEELKQQLQKSQEEDGRKMKIIEKVLRTKAEDDAKGKAEREKLSEELTDQKNQVETLQEQLESSTKENEKLSRELTDHKDQLELFAKENEKWQSALKRSKEQYREELNLRMELQQRFEHLGSILPMLKGGTTSSTGLSLPRVSSREVVVDAPEDNSSLPSVVGPSRKKTPPTSTKGPSSKIYICETCGRKFTSAEKFETHSKKCFLD